MVTRKRLNVTLIRTELVLFLLYERETLSRMIWEVETIRGFD
jgi:hypothetical protein